MYYHWNTRTAQHTDISVNTGDRGGGEVLMGTLAAPLLGSRPKIDLTVLLALGIHIMPPRRCRVCRRTECADRHWGSEEKERKRRLICISSGHQRADAWRVRGMAVPHAEVFRTVQDREKKGKKGKISNNVYPVRKYSPDVRCMNTGGDS